MSKVDYEFLGQVFDDTLSVKKTKKQPSLDKFLHNDTNDNTGDTDDSYDQIVDTYIYDKGLEGLFSDDYIEVMDSGALTHSLLDKIIKKHRYYLDYTKLKLTEKDSIKKRFIEICQNILVDKFHNSKSSLFPSNIVKQNPIIITHNTPVILFIDNYITNPQFTSEILEINNIIFKDIIESETLTYENIIESYRQYNIVYGTNMNSQLVENSVDNVKFYREIYKLLVLIEQKQKTKMNQGCDCPSCRRPRQALDEYMVEGKIVKGKDITPEMSANRDLFPAPPKNKFGYSYNSLGSETWQYPKKLDGDEVDIDKVIYKAEVEDEEILCPISTCPIEEMAMTCYGQVYERESIEEWIAENDTDPITGRFLYSKKLVLHNYNVSEIRQIQKKINQNMMLIHNIPYSLLYPENITEEVTKITHSINNRSRTDDVFFQQWKEYNNNILKYFQQSGSTKNNIDDYLDKKLTNNRPENTGKGFEYLNLGSDMFNKHLHREQNFKYTSFNGTDLNNNTFVQCIFSRCTFVGANLSGCLFQNCSFVGEEVNFANAYTTSDTQFIDCVIEPIGQTRAVGDEFNVRQSFNQRHLDGPYQIICFGY